MVFIVREFGRYDIAFDTFENAETYILNKYGKEPYDLEVVTIDKLIIHTLNKEGDLCVFK